MAKKKNSNWMQRHVSDVYVQQAQKDGYRSRAAYKLLEIQEKDRLFRPGMRVVDLGAAPGGWVQVVSRLIGDSGTLVAMDILPMDPFEDVVFIQGDFREQAVYDQLLEVLDGEQVDVVISDIAPNLSGVKSADQARAMHLAELVLDFSKQVLRPGGDMLVKVFQGEGMDQYRKDVQQAFAKLLTRKPDSSRSESREFYILGKNRIV
ncbi:MAG: 23S rRNA (uridine(2552)-2'-O)-methyltransferase RlmE [Gammaproteobacteria bacterium]|nr:23S rRNA (uridine(2552)-2'-O)-methyltransferase RlmE [Gammaproteobacteria bacterium]